MSAETRKRIVISPDSFKGSLRACDVALAIKRGVDNACLGFETVCLPVSDGGEGTLDSIIEKKSFNIVTVTGPEKKNVNARYGILGDTAVIEMAEAAGLELTANSRRAATATTYGVGELIASALDDGFRKITITAGGSATNDGGCGMASALGIRFIDEAHKRKLRVIVDLPSCASYDYYLNNQNLFLKKENLSPVIPGD